MSNEDNIMEDEIPALGHMDTTMSGTDPAEMELSPSMDTTTNTETFEDVPSLDRQLLSKTAGQPPLLGPKSLSEPSSEERSSDSPVVGSAGSSSEWQEVENNVDLMS